MTPLWLAGTVVGLLVLVTVAWSWWTGRITRGQHAFYDENWSVDALCRGNDRPDYVGKHRDDAPTQVSFIDSSH